HSGSEGLSMAGSGGENDDEITGINVTPLVDITLVLLIIFMMTASYIVTPAIQVDLPKAANSEEVVQSTLALVLTKEARMFFNNSEASEDTLKAFIRSERRKGLELQAVIAADASVQHGKVVHLIDVVKGEGVIKFALNTAADFSAPTEAPTPVAPEAPKP